MKTTLTLLLIALLSLNAQAQLTPTARNLPDSVAGSKVHSTALSQTDEKIDVSHLKEGMYLLHLRLNNGKTRTKRLVVAN